MLIEIVALRHRPVLGVPRQPDQTLYLALLPHGVPTERVSYRRLHYHGNMHRLLDRDLLRGSILLQPPREAMASIDPGSLWEQKTFHQCPFIHRLGH